MTRRSLFRPRALAAPLVLTSVLGWSATEAVTANRTFEGGLSIQAGRKLPDGKWQLIDEFHGRGINFEATVLELATGKQVTTDWALSGKSAGGRSFSARLTGPAQMQSNLLTGQVELRLPFEGMFGDHRFTQQLVLSTDGSVASPKGVLKGRRMQIQDGTSPVALVGETVIDIDLERALPLHKSAAVAEQRRPAGGSQELVVLEDPIATSLLVVSEGTVKAVEQ